MHIIQSDSLETHVVSIKPTCMWIKYVMIAYNLYMLLISTQSPSVLSVLLFRKIVLRSILINQLLQIASFRSNNALRLPPFLKLRGHHRQNSRPCCLQRTAVNQTKKLLRLHLISIHLLPKLSFVVTD